MKILHLLTSGGVGGIEVLCKDICLESTFKHIFCFMFGNGAIYEQMKQLKFNIYSFAKYKKLSLKRLLNIKKIAKECDIIIVHHDDPFLELYYLLLMKILPRKKYISMVHHCYEPISDKQQYGFVKLILKKFIIHSIFQNSNFLIFVSHAGYKSYLTDYQIDQNKVSIIYNGINQEKILRGKKVEKRQNNYKRLIYAGRLVPLKGVDQLVKVFSILSKSHNIVLDIVGDGTQKRYLETMVQEMKISDKVTFYGFQHDISNYLEKADIFVYPSRTEIFGISLVEAMASKCICIANNVGGIPEIITNNINGFLNISNSDEELIQKIQQALKVCENENQRQEMMIQAFSTAEKFSIKKSVYELEKLCKEIVSDCHD